MGTFAQRESIRDVWSGCVLRGLRWCRRACLRTLWRWRRLFLRCLRGARGWWWVMLLRRADGPRRDGGRGCACDGLAGDWREEAAGGVGRYAQWGRGRRADGVFG